MRYQPLALIAELTYRCPLRCVYCSNPLEMKAVESELATSDWKRVISEAKDLGIVQFHLTGGEPLLRPDLEEIIAAARASNLYTNLITSGLGLKEDRLDALIKAGLDHVQLSFQDVDEKRANQISGVKSHALKLEIARLIRSRQVAFTVNIVVHRQNLSRIKEMIEMAESLKADKLEIAHVQYNGWAFKNLRHLLPTKAQLDESVLTVDEARKRLKGKMRIDFVVPDYYAEFPKACMGGWAQKMILMDPTGRAMPCHSAGILPNMVLPNVRDQALKWIWEESPAFNRFRGEEWMSDPCQSCERKTKDFGGCHCQAFLLTGKAEVTDPVCSLSSDRPLIDRLMKEAMAAVDTEAEWTYRAGPRLSGRT